MNVNWLENTIYTKNSIDNIISEKSGIYILQVNKANGKWTTFYIGQTKDIKYRLSEHLSDKEKNECIKRIVNNYICRYSYIIINSQKEKNGIERYLYEYYDRICNKIKPPSDEPIEVNLP